MRLLPFIMAAAAAIPFAAMGRAFANEGDIRISGPHVFDNLAIYFIHGESAEGPVPLSLEEAMKLGQFKVYETGNVGELEIENTGDQGVFIQAGDIVKGGKQDRVITSSLIVPPKSKKMPLAAFCVEQSRWSQRGAEPTARFSSSRESMPSRAAKMYMRDPSPSYSYDEGRPSASPQARVWDSVREMQEKFSASIDEPVGAAESASSLQLSLENEKLNKRRDEYIAALKARGEEGGDVIGYAFAINGKINSADIYSSTGLFRKMWEKQLQSAATEAIGEKSGKADTAPAVEVIKTFLAEGKAGKIREIDPSLKDKLLLRESDAAVYFAASPASPAAESRAIHENFLSKK